MSNIIRSLWHPLVVWKTGSWKTLSSSRSQTRSLSHGSKHVCPAAELGRMLFSKHSSVVAKTGQSFLIIINIFWYGPQVSNLKSIFHDGIDQPLLWASPASPPRLEVKSSKSRRDRTVGRRRYGSNLRLPNNDIQMWARFLMLYMGFPNWWHVDHVDCLYHLVMFAG